MRPGILRSPERPSQRALAAPACGILRPRREARRRTTAPTEGHDHLDRPRESDRLAIQTVRCLVDRHGRGGEVRPSGSAARAGAASPTASGPGSCASPRPIRPGPTATASCSPAATPRRCSTRCSTWPATTCRSTSSGASASSDRRPPGTPSTATPPASRPRPARSARASPTRSAWRSPGAHAGGALQPTGPRAVPAPDLGARLGRRPDGGHRLGGRLARRPSRARRAQGLLRRQPDHDRRADRPRVQRGRRGALRGLRLARAARSTTATTSTAIDARPRRRRGRSRAPDARGGAHPHRLRQPEAGQRRGARRPARGRRCPRHQARAGLARGRELPRTRRRERVAGGSGRPRRGRARRLARAARRVPRRAPGRGGRSRSPARPGELPADWREALPRFEPGTSIATRAASGKMLQRARRAHCPSSSAVRPTCRSRTTR